jgi:hypothetical protein
MDFVEVEIRTEGRREVARVYLVPVAVELDEDVRAAVLGAGSPRLPATLAAALAGFRARVRLGACDGLPAVTAAGVARFSPDVVAPAPVGQGHAYVTRVWLDGANVGDCRAGMTLPTRLVVTRGIHRLLRRVHDRGIVLGRLRPRDLVLVGPDPWLVDLGGLGDGDRAADLRAFADLANWLLEPELSVPPRPGEVVAWGLLIEGYRQAGRAPAEQTVVLADPPPDATVFVPDPEPAIVPRRWRWWLVALWLLAGVALATVLASRW